MTIANLADALLLLAFALVGATIYQLAPAFAPGYAGLMLFVIVWALSKTGDVDNEARQ